MADVIKEAVQHMFKIHQRHIIYICDIYRPISTDIYLYKIRIYQHNILVDIHLLCIVMYYCSSVGFFVFVSPLLYISV